MYKNSIPSLLLPSLCFYILFHSAAAATTTAISSSSNPIHTTNPIAHKKEVEEYLREAGRKSELSELAGERTQKLFSATEKRETTVKNLRECLFSL